MTPFCPFTDREHALETVETGAIDREGRTRIFVVCENGCGYEREVGAGSVLYG